MNLNDLLEREGKLRYPNWAEISANKPAFIEFLRHMMEVAEREGPVAATVREMRAEQVKFFRTRSRDAMDKSKELERQVDACLAPKKSPYTQGGLF